MERSQPSAAHPPARVMIFDTTLRDGEQSPGCSMNLAEKLRVAESLRRLGVDVIEAGFPIASDGDFEAVRAIARRIEGPIICALARCQRGDIERAWEAVRESAKPRIHVFLATSAIHREHKLGMDRPEVLRRAIEGVRQARELCDNIEFSPEDASRTEPEFLAEVTEAVIGAGATTVNIPDTVGYTTPGEYAAVFEYLRAHVRGVDKVVLSAHCHDDLGMAVANSLAAVGAGARQVECTINGIGERAGNAALEEIVMALRTRQDIYGVTTGIDTTHLYPVSRTLAAVTASSVPRNKAVVGRNAFAHEAGIHQHGVLKHRATYEIIRAEDVGYTHQRLVLGKHSGKHAIRDRVHALGYGISEEQLDDVCARFKALADAKKEVFDLDLEALVLGVEAHVEGPWRLEGLSTTGRAGAVRTATVELRHAERGHVVEAGAGDGPVDAVLAAISRATGVPIRLTDYRVQSISEQQDAQGEAVLDAEVGGRIVRGRGVSTDIIEATALAALEIINQTVRIEAHKAGGGETPQAVLAAAGKEGA